MTIEELRKTTFRKGDKAKYYDVIAEIIEIEYTEALFGLRQGKDEIEWVRCENITYIPCALAETSIVPQANELLPLVSNRRKLLIAHNKHILDRLTEYEGDEICDKMVDDFIGNL